jgi:integrase
MPAPYDVFTRLVAYTGMRPEEASGLTLADVDLDDGTVHVRAVVVETREGLFREEFTKTSKSRRIIDLDSTTLAHLTAYVSDHRRRAFSWFASNPEQVHPSEALPLFVGTVVGGRTSDPVLDRLDYSKPMRYSAFNKRHWAKALKAAGLPHIKFYDLRHADVSRHVDRIGRDGALTLKEIQERYGHSSAVMTLDRYAHTGKPDRSARRRALDVAITPSQDNVVPIVRGSAG